MKKPFNRQEVIKLLHKGDKQAVLEYDLTGANLIGADLRYTDLSHVNLADANLTDTDLRYADLTGANLIGAYLRYADLRYADLTDADLTGANLIGADLRYADLTDADLTGANLDFSCLPLWCGSLNMKVDKRIACQIAYHLCSLKCDDEEFVQMRNSILDFANQFHRVGECGKLLPIKKEVNE